ncbi:MAG: hypothetical protein AAFQ14_14070 [Cyanobacteria bacterium J06621_12]
MMRIGTSEYSVRFTKANQDTRTSTLLVSDLQACYLLDTAKQNRLMENTVQSQSPAAPKNPRVNRYLKQAVVVMITTGISWLDLRLSVTIFIIELLWIYGLWRRENR